MVDGVDEVGEWRADPFGRHEHRYWDGREWTEHVSDQGMVAADRPVPSPPAPDVPPPPPGAGVGGAQPRVVYVAQPRTNGLAIASMVLGILWIYGIGSILAVIFGHVSLRQIKRSAGAMRGRGMAIAGLVLGYVGIVGLAALIIVLATVDIDFDTFSTVRCHNDETTLSVAEAAYFSRHGAYGTEADLVTDGFLTRSSGLHDIAVIDNATDYVLVPTGECR